MSTPFILQTPIDRTIMEKAKKEARRVGFRSLQDLVNLYLAQVANNGLSINLGFDEKLSTKSELKLNNDKIQAETEIKEGKLKTYTSADEIMKDLA
jgi:antitoxin component of RelBE/YafQ-DinJ toxin-antitoxin module